jgi:ADP-L-glycero-D-manno-heptose 6-epimerase
LCSDDRWKNLSPLKFKDYINKNDLICNLMQNKYKKITKIIHMGACSSTTEKDVDYLMRNNYEYSKKLFHYCIENNIKFIYASSCATYGDGSNGYDD